MTPTNTCVHVAEGAPMNGCHQCLCAQGELQLPSASLGDSPRAANRSGLGSYQITAFAICLRACEIFFVHPFKSKVSMFPSPLRLPKLGPVVLQRNVLGACLLVQDPRAGEPKVGGPIYHFFGRTRAM